MYDKLRPWLFRLGPELAHTAGIAAAHLAQAVARESVRKQFVYRNSGLRQRILGLTFENPLGLAAGFDKNAVLLPFWETLGFGFAEIGSVTAWPSRGNRRPRAFRLPEDRAIINRMGLPNQGAARIARRIDRVRKRCQIPVGINIAKTRDVAIAGDDAVEDYRQTFARLAPLAGYVTLNISCPNTADGKTFEAPEALDALLTAVFGERKRQLRVPIFLKLAPTISTRVVFDSQIEEILAVGRSHGVNGYVVSNTAADRAGLRTSPQDLAAIGPGGLSGPPLRSRAMQLVRYLYWRLGPMTPIIGVGGIDSAASAYAMLRAGASLLQVYTALTYEGPGLVRRIKEGLVACCEADHLASIGEAVGADAH